MIFDKNKNLSFFVSAFFLLSFLTQCSPMSKVNENAASVNQPQVQKSNGTSCPIWFEKSGFCAELVPFQNPSFVEGQNLTFELRFWEKEGGSPEGPYVSPPAPPAIKIFMSHGHGKGHEGVGTVQVFLQLNLDGSEKPGLYQVSQVYFNMPGHWQITYFIGSRENPVEQVVQDQLISSP